MSKTIPLDRNVHLHMAIVTHFSPFSDLLILVRFIVWKVELHATGKFNCKNISLSFFNVSCMSTGCLIRHILTAQFCANCYKVVKFAHLTHLTVKTKRVIKNMHKSSRKFYVIGIYGKPPNKKATLCTFLQQVFLSARIGDVINSYETFYIK